MSATKNLTVKELLKMLENVNPESMVVVDGYEDGIDIVDTVDVASYIEPADEYHNYTGAYELTRTKNIPAVYLKSSRR
jgi:hypothetical protein